MKEKSLTEKVVHSCLLGVISKMDFYSIRQAQMNKGFTEKRFFYVFDVFHCFFFSANPQLGKKHIYFYIKYLTFVNEWVYISVENY